LVVWVVYPRSSPRILRDGPNHFVPVIPASPLGPSSLKRPLTDVHVLHCPLSMEEAPRPAPSSDDEDSQHPPSPRVQPAVCFHSKTFPSFHNCSGPYFFLGMEEESACVPRIFLGRQTYYQSRFFYSPSDDPPRKGGWRRLCFRQLGGKSLDRRVFIGERSVECPEVRPLPPVMGFSPLGFERLATFSRSRKRLDFF